MADIDYYYYARIIVCRIMENSLRLKRVENSLILDLFSANINSIEFDLHLKNIRKYKNFDKLYINIEQLSEINNEFP